MKLNRCLMWVALFMIGLLCVLSIAGAFYGAEKAKLIFNSIPLAVYWYALAVLFLAGIVEFPGLIHKPGLLMIHAGCLLTLAGAMWGSEGGHKLAKRFFGIDKVPSGYMRIYEGHLSNSIVTKELKPLGQLPFSIKLNDFRIEYYEPDKEVKPQLYIQTADGQNIEMTAEPGQETSLGPDGGKIRVLRIFKNFKIKLDNDKKVVTDEKDAGENPAVELEIYKPDGTSYKHYVFEYFGSHSEAQDGLKLGYFSQGQKFIRDYFSDLVVLKDGKEVLHKTIEVNDPLHYGGYHFYQHSYDAQMGKYTVLSVTSDSGLYAVYSGYWLLCLGVFWQFWFRHIFGYIKRK